MLHEVFWFLVDCQNRAELAHKCLECTRTDRSNTWPSRLISVNFKLFYQAPEVAPEENSPDDAMFPCVIRMVLFKLQKLDSYAKSEVSPRYRLKLMTALRRRCCG